jgi:V-type H+-transporting ATPase subunit C
VQDSEYLETHLIVVPTNARKDFLRSYETLAPMVVPRSSIQVAQDDEFTLFAVTTFKKTSAEFLQKCREQKWTPRQYKYVEGGKEEEQRELARVGKEERKIWGEALRLGRTGWSEAVMIWAHVMTLRVFVETVLRYGLPLEFVCALVKVRSDSHLHVAYLADSGGRQPRNRQRRSSQLSIRRTRTSAEMLLAGINEAESPRMTRHSRPRWRPPAWAPPRVASTRHTYTTRSTFHNLHEAQNTSTARADDKTQGGGNVRLVVRYLRFAMQGRVLSNSSRNPLTLAARTPCL